MAAKYPVHIFGVIVGELFSGQFEGKPDLYPTPDDLKAAYSEAVSPYQVVNQIIASQGDGNAIHLDETDEIRVIKELFSAGLFGLESGYDLAEQREKLSASVLDRIDNWKAQDYAALKGNYRLTFEAININGAVITCERDVNAFGELDAVMLFGQLNASETYLVKKVKEV